MEKFLLGSIKKRKDDFGNEIPKIRQKVSSELTESVMRANVEIFNNKTFRPYQLDIITAVMQNQEDVFVVMPTGGGKSLLYQLPAVLSKGITVVISPLLSLIQEQVTSLINLGIPAAYLSSNCNENMKDQIFNDLGRHFGEREPYLKLLYTTPENLCNSDRLEKMLIELYKKDMLARVVIDEAHCISSWGHDFR